MSALIQNILIKVGQKKDRLLDILLSVQEAESFVSDENIKIIAGSLQLSEIDVRQCMSFYHFFSTKPSRHRIFLNDSVMANLMGGQKVKEAFEKVLNCKQGEINADGIGFYTTACIGMSDQEPAAMIDGVIFPSLTPERVRFVVEGINQGKSLSDLYYLPLGDGRNGGAALNTMVNSNIRKTGLLLDDYYKSGSALTIAIEKSELEVIGIVKTSGLRGRGGAGFPTGMKWEFCRSSEGAEKYIICNADEGEPGTFKDRVILTEKIEMLLEGMTIAAYAIGAREGIIYLRHEYQYMRQHIENALAVARTKKMLGNNILGKDGFDFDIRIQFGAGAYVCGEESSLIESMEGKRGEPRFKPPFPVQKGYHNKPTSVNNVETFCKVCRIIERGGEWYRRYGTKQSVGTKLLSISGDCPRPGVYEIEWGMTLYQMLEMVGATNTQAIQVGGPSGSLIGKTGFDRKICYSDISTGGSMMIFDQSRDLIKDVVLNFLEFFIDESCGSCLSCRACTQQIRNKLEKMIHGKGVSTDIEDLKKWAKFTLVSRCGLGQSAANPISTSIANFPHLYQAMVQKEKDYDTCFDLASAVADSCKVVNRVPNF
jgi:[NiFe] hydrogenase diaphorase moiety large subunit